MGNRGEVTMALAVVLAIAAIGGIIYAETKTAWGQREQTRGRHQGETHHPAAPFVQD